MERPPGYDGTDAVRQNLQPTRPSSGRKLTTEEQEKAARYFAEGRIERIQEDTDERLPDTANADDGDIPMTEAEIRELEAEPPPTPPRAELPLQFPTKGAGVYTTYRGPEERKAYLADKKELKKLEKYKQRYDELAAKASDTHGTLTIEEKKLRELRYEATQNPSLPAQKLFYQEQEVEKAWARLTTAEKERDAAELDLHRQLELCNETERATALEEMNMATLASARQQDEVSRAQTKVKAAAAQWKKELADEAAAKAEKDRKAEQADFHQRKGKNRLAAEQARNKEKDKQIESLRDAEFNHKAQRHLKLKESITRIGNAMDSENEKRRKKMAARLEAQEKEKKELMAAGLNPYEVFRRRELEEKQEEIKIKSSALKQMRQEQMLEKIMAEDVKIRKDEEVKEEERQAAAAFQREMNGVERRRKMMNYITQQTVGHVDVLDPTGKAMRIDPSKVTVQKTMDFGLGRARPELLAKMDKKLAQQAVDLHQTADQDQTTSGTSWARKPSMTTRARRTSS